MKFLNFNKILCLSPHPDDIEYAMGGSIIKCKDTHFDILCLSSGGDWDNTTGPHRLNEIYNSWNTIKCTNILLLNSNVIFINEKKEDEWINYIETKLLNIEKYNCMFCPPTIDSHFEHQFVNRISNTLIRTHPVSLIEYFTPSTLNNWTPNLFVDITAVYNKKILMLKKFKSQQHKLYFKKNVLDSFHSNYQCSKRKIDKSEKFKINTSYIL
jgi:N-acetylglucosamine malate deacetylase 1